MTNEQEVHLQRIKEQFILSVDPKYRAGVKEHGGTLWEMTPLQLIENAVLECIDQFTYLQTLRDVYLKQELERIHGPR